MTLTGLGPRVIGEKAAEEEKIVQERHEHILGPRVIGERETPTTADPGKAKPKAEEKQLTFAERLIDGTNADVEENVAGVNSIDALREALELEQERSNRKGATRALLGRIQELEELEEKKENIDRQTGEPKPQEDDEGDDGDDPTSVPPTEGSDVNADGYISIDELDALLEDDPTQLDKAIKAEFKREPRPRVGALRVLLSHEQRREEGARDGIVSSLEDAIVQGAEE